MTERQDALSNAIGAAQLDWIQAKMESASVVGRQSQFWRGYMAALTNQITELTIMRDGPDDGLMSRLKAPERVL